MMAETMLDGQYTSPLEAEFHKQISSVPFKHLVLNERKVYSNSCFQPLFDCKLSVAGCHSVDDSNTTI